MRLTRILLFVFLMTTPFALAQDKPAQLSAKDSEASKALNDLAKSQAADQKNLNDLFQQARTSLDQNQKALNDELKKSQDALNAKLKADKKYRDDFAHMESLQKQVTDLGTKAQADFVKSISPIQQKLQTENAQVQGLVPVVRKENGWPDTVQFDPATQKWVDTAKK